MTITKLVFALTCLVSTTSNIAQEQKKDGPKIQEVITLNADPVSQTPLADGSIPADTTGPKPMAQAEILKRAINFAKIESSKYVKGTPITTGGKAEFTANFKYKSKELNPQADVEGLFTMHVSIDAKPGKYRYTISKINHVAKNAEYSGGDVYSEVPACGSFKLPNNLWKQMKSEAIKQAMTIVAELKEAMKVPSDKQIDKEEW
jgi:hypothetical protein